MHSHHPIVLRLALAAAALALLCGAVGLAALLLRQPAPRNSSELVAQELGRRGVRHEQVVLGAMWPDQTNLQYGSYAGPVTMGVTVQLADGRATRGWLECRELGRGCTLTLRGLGIDDAPLPDLAAPAPPAWLAWLREQAPWLPWQLAQRL